MVITFYHMLGVKSVQIRSYFWSIFSCFRTRNNSVFGHFSLWKHVSKLITENHHTLRSSRPQVFLRKGVLKLCIKFREEHPWWSVISIKLLFNRSFSKNTSGRLLLYTDSRDNLVLNSSFFDSQIKLAHGLIWFQK